MLFRAFEMNIFTKSISKIYTWLVWRFYGRSLGGGGGGVIVRLSRVPFYSKSFISLHSFVNFEIFKQLELYPLNYPLISISCSGSYSLHRKLKTYSQRRKVRSYSQRRKLKSYSQRRKLKSYSQRRSFLFQITNNWFEYN